MLQEDKHILWRASAALLGAALPAMMLGKGVMFGLLLAGIVTGLLATKDESLRGTIKLLLNSWISVLMLAILAALLVGVVTGIDPEFSLDKWGQVVIAVLASALLFVTLREMPGRHLELLLKVLAVGTLAAAGVSVLDAVLGDVRLSAALHGSDKALTPYRLNYMSSVLAVLLPFVWARLLLKAREGEPFAVRIALPAAMFGTIAALACGGRAGWAGLFVAIFIFLWLAGRYHGLVIHARHWLGGLLAIAAGLALYGFAFGWDFMWQRTSIVGEIGQGRGMLSGRGEVWASALRHLGDMPVFGIGVMNFRNLPDTVDLHPHNWVLQVLLETGIVGFALFMTLMVMVAMRFGKYAKGNIYGVAGLASLCAFLVAGLANTSIFNLWWLTYLIFVCLLGWRAGWGGDDLKKRRRRSVVVK